MWFFPVFEGSSGMYFNKLIVYIGPDTGTLFLLRILTNMRRHRQFFDLISFTGYCSDKWTSGLMSGKVLVVIYVNHILDDYMIPLLPDIMV